MNVFFLYKNRDFDLQKKSPWNNEALAQDLELKTLFDAMASGDEFLYEVVMKTIFSGLDSDLDTIFYRQNILKDCLENCSIARDIYNIAVEAIESRKDTWFGIFTSYPSSILSGSLGMMGIYVAILKKLRAIADEHARKFRSEGFTRFFEMLKKELSDEYFIEIENHLSALKFRDGILISAELGKGNKGINYTLRKLQVTKKNWLEKIFGRKEPWYTFSVHPRDESGVRALSDLKNEGINLVANALAQSCDHILGFFNMLQTELAFYVGCLNLQEQFSQMNEPSSFPNPLPAHERKHSFKGLYEACLALSMKRKIVSNDMEAGDKNPVIITGANQGGKSTFLRSIGVAQLMMQSGMFIPAESFTANICDSIFTHFKREEDVTMKSGKFDEELSRMNDITNHIKPNSMILFNESFAATNEREGSEIARQIVSALIEKNIQVFFVTHLYEFARSFYDANRESALFLRAERQTDTSRTFKLTEGKPLETSYGIDLYNKIFSHDKINKTAGVS
ncbi:MAG: MutS-related protein [Ginsengibacter sp.]